MAGLVYSRIRPFRADSGGGFAKVAGCLTTHPVANEGLQASSRLGSSHMQIPVLQHGNLPEHNSQAERRKQLYHPQ